MGRHGIQLSPPRHLEFHFARPKLQHAEIQYRDSSLPLGCREGSRWRILVRHRSGTGKRIRALYLPCPCPELGQRQLPLCLQAIRDPKRECLVRQHAGGCFLYLQFRYFRHPDPSRIPLPASQFRFSRNSSTTGCDALGHGKTRLPGYFHQDRRNRSQCHQ